MSNSAAVRLQPTLVQIVFAGLSMLRGFASSASARIPRRPGWAGRVSHPWRPSIRRSHQHSGSRRCKGATRRKVFFITCSAHPGPGIQRTSNSSVSRLRTRSTLFFCGAPAASCTVGTRTVSVPLTCGSVGGGLGLTGVTSFYTLRHLTISATDES